MNDVLPLLKAWGADAERLAGYLPQLAGLLGGSWAAAAVVALVGAALLVAGVRLGRVLAAAGGGLVGWAAGGVLVAAGGNPVPAGAATWVVACVVAAASGLAPAVYPAALGLLPGALLGLRIPVLGHPWLGGVLGAALLAGLLVLLRRLVLAATAALLGAALLGVALLAAAARVPALRLVADRPMLMMALGAVLVVAGTAFQLETRRGPEPARAAPPERR